MEKCFGRKVDILIIYSSYPRKSTVYLHQTENSLITNMMSIRQYCCQNTKKWGFLAYIDKFPKKPNYHMWRRSVCCPRNLDFMRVCGNIWRKCSCVFKIIEMDKFPSGWGRGNIMWVYKSSFISWKGTMGHTTHFFQWSSHIAITYVNRWRQK